MARLPFVDTHVHYWDLHDPSLRYEWLMPDWVHPVLGNIDGIKVQRYMAPDFIAESPVRKIILKYLPSPHISAVNRRD